EFRRVLFRSQVALAQADGASLNAVIAAVERQARLLGAEEIYVAAAPDLAREVRFIRIEGELPRGKNFALRATVAYKGTWVRLVRAFREPALLDEAAAQLAEAVAHLPSGDGFAKFKSFVV